MVAGAASQQKTAGRQNPGRIEPEQNPGRNARERMFVGIVVAVVAVVEDVVALLMQMLLVYLN